MKQGMATPVTLLVLMVVFVGLLSATSYMALGALKGTATERAVLQAFLVAESALNALEAQAAQDRRVLCNALPSYSLAGNTATYTKEVFRENNKNRFRITATATVGGATARVQGVYPYACPFPLGAPAALTSRPGIEVRGNAEVNGRDVDAVNLTTTQAARSFGPTPPPPYTLPVANASGIAAGSYIRVSGQVFKVTAVSGNTLTLEPITPLNANLSIPAGSSVELLLYPVLEQTNTSGNASTLRLPTTLGLVAGQPIRLTVGGQTYNGQLTQVDGAGGTVRVSWQGSPPPNPTPGTPLRVSLLGAASYLSIDIQGNARITNGYQQNSPLVPSNPENLFQMIFGMDKSAFRALYPGISPNQFNGTLSNWELKVVNQSINSNVQLCGQGILVVFGELRVNGTCDAGFQGLVYVAGDYDQQGNAQIQGAVVVEGVAELQNCTGEDCWTNIAGTGQRAGKITFDPWVMYRLRSAGEEAEAFQRLQWRRL